MRTSRIELYIGGVLHDAYPIYSDKIRVDKEREGDEMYYRTKLNGNIRFVGNDFDLIEGQRIDTEMTLKVYGIDTVYEEGGSIVSHPETLLVEGRFTKMDCTFNYDDKVCDVKVTSVDAYDKVLGGIGNEYDLISLAPERKPITLTKRAILQIYRLRDTKITNVIGNMSYEVDVNSEVDIESLNPTVLQNTYHFARVEENHIYVHLVIDNTRGTLTDISDADGWYEGYKTSERTVLNKLDGSGFSLGEYQSDYGYTLLLMSNGSPVTHVDATYGNVYVGSGYSPSRFDFSDITSLVFYGMDVYSYGIKTTAYSMIAYPELVNTFFRILTDLNQSGAYNIPSVDIAVQNLNYHYVYNDTRLDQMAEHIIRSDEVQNEPTKWGVNGDGKYFVRPIVNYAYENAIPIGWETWGHYSVWYKSDNQYSILVDDSNVNFVLNDAIPLYSAIKVLLGKIDSSITFEPTADYSQFLFGDLPAGTIGGHVAQDFYITPITNIKRTYYDQAARKGIMTLKDILDMLRNTMRLYWFVDDEKRLRIEHITWFRNGGSYTATQPPIISLTALKSPMLMKRWSEGLNSISYDAKSLVKRYEFAWAAETSEVFEGFAMDVKNPSAKDGKTLNASVARFISDVDLVISAPDVLGDDLFTIIGVPRGTIRCPVTYISVNYLHTPQYGMQNPYLSFLWLEDKYWRHDMGGDDVIAEGYTHEGEECSVPVLGVQRVRKQSVRFPIATDKVGKEGLIRTGIGKGQWVKASYSLEDGMADMDIVLDIE